MKRQVNRRFGGVLSGHGKRVTEPGLQGNNARLNKQSDKPESDLPSTVAQSAQYGMITVWWLGGSPIQPYM